MEVTARHALTLSAAPGRHVWALTGRLPRVGLSGVLADLDRRAIAVPVPGEAAGAGFTWDGRDATDPAWWPQGVASREGGGVLLVSWYAKHQRARTQGSRISVVDRRDTDHPRYRHVLLVAARRRPYLSMGVVPVHAGGIAVLGDLLYVADTLTGVRVFDLRDIVRVPRRRLDALLPWPGAGTHTVGRRPTGGFTAYGYDYVLPQRADLHVARVSGTGRLRYSFLSIGDVAGQAGGDVPGAPSGGLSGALSRGLSLVVGEYRRAGASPRLLRYVLAPESGLPVAGPDGRAHPVEVHAGQPPRMQGVAVDGSTWFVTASSGQDRPGDLYVGRPGAFHRHRGVLPTGPEDLDWSVPGQELWCVTEWPGQRWVFPIHAPDWLANADRTTASPESPKPQI